MLGTEGRKFENAMMLTIRTRTIIKKLNFNSLLLMKSVSGCLERDYIREEQKAAT